MKILRDIAESSGIDVIKALKYRNDESANGGIRKIKVCIYEQHFKSAEKIEEIAKISNKLKEVLKEELADTLLAWHVLCGIIDEAATMRMETIYNQVRKDIEIEGGSTE